MLNQVIEGEALKTLSAFPSEFFDVVMIDPPYSSGGAFRGDRMQSTNVKYTKGDVRPETLRLDFAGDTRDQRSYAYWLALVLSEALRVTKPQGVIVCFTDWRQLPATTDAIQAGGWCWRGLCVWDKGEGARPTLGRFTSQCEYIIWGSKGDMPLDRLDGAEKRTLPGLFRVPVRQVDKHHVTGKPTALMRQLLAICPPGGTVLDCFAGSGSTLVAAKLLGLPFVGVLPDRSVQTCVTSPPYFGLRDYGTADQIGLEPTPAAFVAELVAVFREVRRVLADDGTVWLNLGDSYAHSTANTDSFRRDKAECGIGKVKKHGLKTSDLIGIPWRVAFALQEDGWYLRQDIIWHKPNPMPSPVQSRCTSAHEYIFLLSKKKKYYFNAAAIQEPIAPSQVGRVRADLVGGTSHKERGQHSVGHVYTGPRPRVNEDDRKPLRTDTENRHRTAIPGGQSLKTERPQLVRARELAAEHHLTEAHIEAIRACGFTDTGKNKATQTGTGRNTDEVQRLAAEAKAALGGYYREFLLADTRNRRSVWTVATQPYAGAHFATFPPELIRPCILAGSRPGDVVLDPFLGSGTTLQVALEEGRQGWGCELNPEYLPLIHKRLRKVQQRIQF